MGAHLINGEFQSDKYPTCPAGKVPLSVKDETAQDLLWQYAQRRRLVDAEFSNDLEAALLTAGYRPNRKDLGLSDLASRVVRRSDLESRSVNVRTAPIRSLIVEAVQHIPPGFHLTIAIERAVNDDGSDGSECLHASIYQHPPEDEDGESIGWSVRGVDEQPEGGWSEVLGSTEPGAYHPADKFSDRVLWGISAVNPEAFERLLVASILRQWPKARPGLWVDASHGNKHGLR
jgi:hypothetical protein